MWWNQPTRGSFSDWLPSCRTSARPLRSPRSTTATEGKINNKQHYHFNGTTHAKLYTPTPEGLGSLQLHGNGASSKGNVIKCMLTELLNECECWRAAVWLSLVWYAEKMRPPRSYRPNRKRRQTPSNAVLVFTVSTCRCTNTAPDRYINQTSLSVNLHFHKLILCNLLLCVLKTHTPVFCPVHQTSKYTTTTQGHDCIVQIPRIARTVSEK